MFNLNFCCGHLDFLFKQRLTCLMLDLLKHLEKLQKDCQRSFITMPDVELSKRIFVDSLSMMEDGCYPGGYEERFMESESTKESESDSDIEEVPRRCKVNSLVSTKRCWSAVRKETVMSCKEYISQRLEEDQIGILHRINAFINARSATEVVNAARLDVENLFGKDKVSDFTDDVVGMYAVGKLPPSSDMTSSTAKLYHYFKASQPHSTFNKLVQSYVSLNPHSADPERAVSVHTILKSNKQSSFSREALNSRMYIALNGVGTSFYDPRPAVGRFLEKKERRRKLPDCYRA